MGSFEIWISWAILGLVAQFLATHAFPREIVISWIHQVLIGLVICVFLGYVLSKFAARVVFVSFPTAPPNFSTIFRLMCPTAPIEIPLLSIVPSTVLACFNSHSDLALFSFNLLNLSL